MSVPYGVNDYPGCCGVGSPPYCGCGGADLSCRVDQWGYGAGQCVSFTAHRVAQGGLNPAGFGNADTWAQRAAARGWRVTSSPEGPGDIITFPPGCHGAGSVGHVACVIHVNADGSVLAEQYNYLGCGASGWCEYSQCTYSVACGMRFIHPPYVARACPAGCTGTPPSCDCSCPAGCTGTQPNCSCPPPPPVCPPGYVAVGSTCEPVLSGRGTSILPVFLILGGAGVAMELNLRYRGHSLAEYLHRDAGGGFAGPRSARAARPPDRLVARRPARAHVRVAGFS